MLHLYVNFSLLWDECYLFLSGIMSLNENLSQNIHNISGLQEIWWHDFVNRTFTYNKNE